MLVETPKTPMTRMYFRSPQRVNKDTTYVFPRNPGGGVILGGCRFDNEWNGEVDLSLAEDIKRRCCALAPELGKPEDLKVISHSVGLRRKLYRKFYPGDVLTRSSKQKGRGAD
jgi:D-amino-acid oxidase